MNIVRKRRHRRLSLRTRVRWALFGFGAAAAIVLALGALLIDETLEQLIMKSTLQAEARHFAAQIRHSDVKRLNTTVLRGYFIPESTGGGTAKSGDDEFLMPRNPDFLDRPDENTAPFGPSLLQRHTAADGLLSTDRLGGSLSRGLESFFWHYAQSGQAPPAALQSLSTGFHEDIPLNGRTYYLLVKDLPHGRLYLAYDTTRLRRHLYWFSGLLLGSVLLILLAADRLGSRMADRLTQPLEALAQHLETIDPAQRGLRVAERQRDPELDQIAIAFNTYLTRMDDFVRREQAFTQTASHELRTPLTVISGAAELMRAQIAAGIHDERALRRIQRATRQMTETVEALLALARTARPDADELCHIDRLLPNIVEAHAYLVEDAPVTLELGELEAVTVRASARLLDILIGNLLRNAIQNTREGRVRVSIRGHSLEVADTGIGIDPEEAPALLQRGQRGAQALGSGHGLGLYIVGEICARYGWAIVLDTHCGGGACVRVDFAPPAAHQPTASSP